MIDEKTQQNIDSWLAGPYDKASQEEVLRLQKENPEELSDAFYTHLSFGTGGLRGLMGVGTNRMNEYTVAMATQGLANYMKKQNPTAKKLTVLIGYDTRKNSRKFAETAASVLAANDIDVLLYKEFRSIPAVSFGVLYKKLQAGIMITASHNPPQYNGYKVYWNHGGQVVHPEDTGIIDEVAKVTPDLVKKVSFPHSRITEVGEEIDEAYLKEIHKLQLHPGTNQSHGKELHIVYTSLHGGGINMVPTALKSWGFGVITIVEEQKATDGTFSTIKTPNPEERATLDLGVKALARVHGDILLATDPDVDRLAVVVMHDNQPFYFNGNEIACLALEHICRSLKEAKKMPPKPMAVKTIVTTELFRSIGDHYDLLSLDVLTGFKYIGEKIAQWEEDKLAEVQTHHFLFGAEESYGYLFGTHARDKDAIVMANLISEMALQLKLQGKTLVDFLYEIYHKHGVFREKLFSMNFEGKKGEEKIEALMDHVRKNPPKTIGNATVVSFEDYLTHTHVFSETGHKEPIVLPSSNVLRFFLSDKTKIVIRPSGTEPKIKVYVSCFEKHFLTNKHAIEKAIKECDLRVDTYISWIKKILT